jgi:phosphatidylglycerophosphate synthase
MGACLTHIAQCQAAISHPHTVRCALISLLSCCLLLAGWSAGLSPPPHSSTRLTRGSRHVCVCFRVPDKEVPAWVNILCGVNLFIYQTMDAMDGKQARRTKSSSALGQLFDHGCDAVSTFLGAISLCACLQIGARLALTFVTFSSVAFFSAQWNEYYTHVLKTNLGGVFGVSEAQVRK